MGCSSNTCPAAAVAAEFGTISCRLLWSSNYQAAVKLRAAADCFFNDPLFNFSLILSTITYRIIIIIIVIIMTMIKLIIIMIIKVVIRLIILLLPFVYDVFKDYAVL
jgi:hypothetical protein